MIQKSTWQPIIERYESKAEWLAARDYIGGSSSPAIIGEGYAGQNQVTVWESLVYPGQAPPLEGEHLDMGLFIEPAINAAYMAKVEHPVELNGYTVYRHPIYRFLACTPDAKWLGVNRGAQYKNVSVFAGGNWNDDDPPLKHNIQCQHEMMCTGWDAIDLVGLIGGNKLKVFTIERDEKFIAGLEKHLVRWWEKYVLTRQMPPVDGDAATSQVLTRLHPDDNGEAVTLNGAVDGVLDAIESIDAEIKTKEDTIAALKNQLRNLLGDATYGLLPSGRCLSWKTQERSGHVVQPSKSRVLRILKRTPRGVK